MPEPPLGSEPTPAPAPGADGITGLRPTLRGGAPPVRGSDVLTAILPSGRVAWLQLDPVPAPVAELNHLAQAVERMDLRRAADGGSVDEGLGRLSRAVATDAERISGERRRRHRALRRRLLGANRRLERRATARAGALRTEVDAQRALELGLARRLRRRDLWDHLVVASSLPLFAAFGQRGSPLAERNVVLALSLAVWLVGDEVSDLLTGTREPRAVVRDADIWSYLAPPANLLSGWLLLHGEPHERFATGISELGPPLPAREPGSYLYAELAPRELADVVANGGRDGIPAVASVVSLAVRNPAPGVTARVRRVTADVDAAALTLKLEVTVAVDPPETPAADVAAAFPSVQVAWIVDLEGA